MLLTLLSLLIVGLLSVSLTAFLPLWACVAIGGGLLLLTWPLSRWLDLSLGFGSLGLAPLALLAWAGAGFLWWGQNFAPRKPVRPVALTPLKQDVEATAFVNKNELRLEQDKLIYTLQIRYKKGLKLKLPKVTTHPTFNGPFIMPTKTPPRITNLPEKEGVVGKRWVLTLVPIQTGPLDTPRFVIRYKKGKETKEVVVARIALDVVDAKKVKGKNGGLDLVAAKSVILPEKLPVRVHWLMVGLLAGGAFVALLLLVFLIRMERAPEPEIPPHEWFAQKIKFIKTQQPESEEDWKQYSFQISEVFRGYLERQFAFPALENTTEEIVHWFKQDRDTGADVQRDIRKLLQWMDEIKFAGYLPDDGERSEQETRLGVVVQRTTPKEEEQQAAAQA
jgi:hypothetical protein